LGVGVGSLGLEEEEAPQWEQMKNKNQHTKKEERNQYKPERRRAGGTWPDGNLHLDLLRHPTRVTACIKVRRPVDQTDKKS
jgi:hypothetical protein